MIILTWIVLVLIGLLFITPTIFILGSELYDFILKSAESHDLPALFLIILSPFSLFCFLHLFFGKNKNSKSDSNIALKNGICYACNGTGKKRYYGYDFLPKCTECTVCNGKGRL